MTARYATSVSSTAVSLPFSPCSQHFCLLHQIWPSVVPSSLYTVVASLHSCFLSKRLTSPTASRYCGEHHQWTVNVCALPDCCIPVCSVSFRIPLLMLHRIPTYLTCIHARQAQVQVQVIWGPRQKKSNLFISFHDSTISAMNSFWVGASRKPSMTCQTTISESGKRRRI
jgi:hypothetical protein